MLHASYLHFTGEAGGTKELSEDTARWGGSEVWSQAILFQTLTGFEPLCSSWSVEVLSDRDEAQVPVDS